MDMDIEPADEIECPRCGEAVYYEVTRCPNCGWNFYDPEANEEREWVETSPSENWLKQMLAGFSLLAVVLGLGMAALIYFAITWSISSVYSANNLPLWARVVLFLSGLLAGTGAGRTAGRYVTNNWKINALPIGIGVGLLALLFDGYWNPSPARWDVLLLIILAVGGVYWGLHDVFQQREQAKLNQLFFPEKTEELLYQDLLVRVQFDRSVAERLVQFEQRRAPFAQRKQWIETAIQRWERDNR